MGWNDLDIKSDHLLFEGIETGADVYFVHSYHFELADESHLLASVNYGSDITAVIGRDNIIGTQFHPEKSQKYGLKFIENFLKWRP
jgi:glutamine amidotransferase